MIIESMPSNPQSLCRRRELGEHLPPLSSPALPATGELPAPHSRNRAGIGLALINRDRVFARAAASGIRNSNFAIRNFDTPSVRTFESVTRQLQNVKEPRPTMRPSLRFRESAIRNRQSIVFGILGAVGDVACLRWRCRVDRGRGTDW
jgi:hypothetical protein